MFVKEDDGIGVNLRLLVRDSTVHIGPNTIGRLCADNHM